MEQIRRIELELLATGWREPISMRLEESRDRWVASVRSLGARTTGIGASPREALVAALTPLGARTTTAVMSDPTMFAASAQLLA